MVNFIPEAIIFPTFVDRTYSGLGLQFKIAFQAIQNYIPDDDGNRLPNTIENAQKIFSEFANDDLLPPAPLEYFDTNINEDGDVVLELKEGEVYPETLVLPSYDSVGRKIKVIGNTFANNTTIKNLIVPSGYTAIEPSAFENNKTIEFVDLSRTQIVEISQNAFFKSSIKNVVLPDTIKTLGQYAFRDSNLTSIILPEGIEKIENSALWITDLSALYIPKTLSYMGGAPIYSPVLSKIVVDDDNPYFMDVNNEILYNKNQTKLIFVVPQSQIINFVMPSSVTSASTYSLNYPLKLKNIIFNDNVFALPYLQMCHALEWIELKTTVVPPLAGSQGIETWFTGRVTKIDIYVPDSAVESYKDAWGDYITNIYSISER